MRIPGAVRATGIGAQLQGSASGVCETRGSHRAIAGGLGKGLAGKSATQRATKTAANGLPAAVECHRAIKLALLFEDDKRVRKIKSLTYPLFRFNSSEVNNSVSY